MANKKADITFDSIATSALIVIVIIVIGIIVRNIVFGASSGLKEIGESSVSQAKGERCKSVFGIERACYSSVCPQATEHYIYEEVSGEFSDCPQKIGENKFKTDDKGNKLDKCCERIKKEKPEAS